MEKNFGLYFNEFPIVQGSLEEQLSEANTLVFPNGKAVLDFLDSFGDDPQKIPYKLWRDIHNQVHTYDSAPICICYDNGEYRRMHNGIAQAMWEFHLKNR